jgi:sterol desaturase/sphingolipid hydroxylase (fatty acid hydroxylase superfamily)
VKAFLLIYGLASLSGWGLIFLLSPETYALAWQHLYNTFTYKPFTFMIVAVLALSIVLLLEFILVEPEKSSLRRILNPDASMARDQLSCLAHIIGLWFIVGYLLTLGLPFFLGKYLISLFPALTGLQFISLIDSTLLRFIISFVLIDLFFYLAHRVMHAFTPLWNFHQYHHSSEKMTVFSNNRSSPFALSIKKVVAAIPATFFGANISDYVLVLFLYEVNQFILHSEINADWGWLGKWVFISPRFHRIHHSREEENNRSNYGIILVIWDRIFGSYNPHAVVTSFGIKDVDYNRMPFLVGIFYGVQITFFKRK